MSRPARATAAGDARLVALVAAVVLAVYAPTVARDLTWSGAGDGGELIAAAMTLGVPHPPGYPTYVLLGRLFALLPLGSVAFRFNLFSAVCVAAAAGLLVLAMRRRWGARLRPAAAVAAALTFAFLPLVWSQAVVAEVYGLNLLCVVAFVAVWLRRGPSLAGGLLLGLAITAHPTSWLLAPAALLGGRGRARLLAGAAIGLLPLLALPLLARGDSPIVWGRPDTAAGWWWLVSGRLYAANVRPPDTEHLAALLRALALGPAALLVGRTAMAGATGAPAGAIERRAWLLGATAALYALFALAYAPADAAVQLLPALALLALWLAPRLNALGGWSLALPLAAVVLALWSGRFAPDVAAAPRAAAEAVLSAAPPGALLLTPGDRSLFALWYYHHVEGRRPDVIIADTSLFAFDWYRERLAAQHPALFVPAGDDLPALRQGNLATRPVCAVSLMTTPFLTCAEAIP